MGAELRPRLNRRRETDSVSHGTYSILDVNRGWCDCTPENQKRFGCPHGYGGPAHARGGYFSEMCEEDPFEISDPDLDPHTSMLEPYEVVRRCNAIVLEYCSAGMEARPEYSPCLCPGLWLAVPDDWRRG